jgi:cysteine desulfurase
MAANNETGVIQPIDQVGQRVHESGGFFHVDAVQKAGQSSFDFAASGAHFAALSAHKAGGPSGVGCLITSCDAEITPLLAGGGQEKNRRGGTENLVGITGFAAALESAANDPNENGRVMGLRNELEYAIKTANNRVKIWGENQPRLHNTICLSAPGWPSEIQVIAMDLAGYAVSAGAACSSGKVKASRVLQAMGANGAEASSALRISLGWATTEEDITGFAKAWQDNYTRAVR